MHSENLRVLRLRDVKAITGLSTSTIYDKIAKNRFPQPIALGEAARG